jgi:hypothetical protein
MRRRARQPKPEILGEILRKILKKRNIPHAAADPRLLDVWRRAVGPQIAAQTHPEKVKRGVLFVRVSSSVWMHQLQFLKEEIIGRLNEFFREAEIGGLFFSLGEIPPAPPGTDDPPLPDPGPSPLGNRDRNLVRKSLEAIRDPELRGILERVMTLEISRRRRTEKRKVR